MVKRINIKFLFFDDKTCSRCKTIEDFLNSAIAKFKQSHRNVEINLEKQKLAEILIEKSPTILLDGKDLETYLLPTEKEIQSSPCQDCSCLVGKPVSCRTYGNNESLSEEQILIALEKHSQLLGAAPGT